MCLIKKCRQVINPVKCCRCSEVINQESERFLVYGFDGDWTSHLPKVPGDGQTVDATELQLQNVRVNSEVKFANVFKQVYAR